ncbi:MAG: trypsin-like peptidase domain-containing protein [Armatimonadetes bacterium]|nr:trypsin-like peptidase domain-containing protein [Armatimonadota bacterium]
MNRVGPYVLMFLVCFAGVYAALTLHDRMSQGPSALQQLAEAEPVRYEKTPGQIAFSEAAQILMPSVVSVERLQARSFHGSTGEPQLAGLGSGVIITPDGYIVTNFHVVENADVVTVHLLNGDGYEAEIVGTDRLSDLALLKVDTEGLPAAELGPSDDLVVGEWIMAVGNPLGYEGTLSVGVVSALNRDLGGSGSRFPLVGAIQTDAAINQGNSGGPLANIHGQIVGINTVIASTDQGSVGIGFAIPSSRVKRFVSDIQKFGRVRHPDFGVTSFMHPSARFHPRFRMQVGEDPPREGLILGGLAPESPLEQADIERYAILLEFDGAPISTLNDYWTFLLKAEIGQSVKVRYWQHGEYGTATITLTEMNN